MHKIDNTHLTLDKLHQIIHENQSIVLSEDAIERIQNCREFLDKQSKKNTPIYGINTGFGSLCNESISEDKLEELQVNLVVSHACGFGEEVPSQVVKLMLCLLYTSPSPRD